jgi:ubiquitin carboxyl-terminal hydrolase 4/11/15
MKGNPPFKESLLLAMQDLNLCLTIMAASPDAYDTSEQERMKTSLERLEKTCAALLEVSNTNTESEPTTIENGTTSNNNHHSEDSDTDTKPPKVVSQQQQKQDVMRLLLARKQVMANDTTDPQQQPKKGEAFFLVDWKWWCQWCHYVDFFYRELHDTQQQRKQLQMVLELFPAGAILPDIPNDDDSDSDVDSEDEDAVLVGGSLPSTPGVIDNARLLFGEKPHGFYKQWYDTSALRPNLVRGYHYELLPREVFSALRAWYGEVTPSVCFRTTAQGAIVLYPPRVKSSSPTASQRCSACRAPHATARCKRCMAVFYCDRECQTGHWPHHKLVCKTLTTAATTNSHGHDNPSVVVDAYAGRIGLHSLGNTCFMNSALQCLSHATPLTRHFLSNKFKADVNTSNPLGTRGKLANAYDDVMKDLWMTHAARGGAASPSTLKRAIAQFAPRFAGCLQHDSQEFLAYLLDGLHEDLNRITKAPYVEMPDATNGANMAIAGAQAWDAHLRRNDSLVMDTVYGQFKSTCICPKCEKVSVSFDAFNHVSLEIPQHQNLQMTISILVFRTPPRNHESSKDNNDKIPLRYGVSLSRNSLVADLRRELSGLIGVPPNRFILCDIYENSVYELLHDKKTISSFRSSDVLAAYEVDPYTNSSIHVVATHAMRVESPLSEGKDDERPSPSQMQVFGFPLMTSFDANSTCKQVYACIWEHMDTAVVQDGAPDAYVDKNGKHCRQDVLQIRIVDNQGKSIVISQDPKATEASEDSKTSILPYASNEKIQDLLGKECTENFLFMTLEWQNPVEEESPEGGDQENDAKKSLIQPSRFLRFADHPTLADANRKQRAKNGVNGVSLDDCFQTFTKPERLDENNMWYCSKCKAHVRALKTMKLWRLPNILVVHLKRFEFKHALRRDKLDTFVDFPLEGLDMNSHRADWTTAESDKNKSFVDATVPADYDCFAVVNHFGRMGFGHYTAHARSWDESGISKDWAYFDDSSVRSVGDGKGPNGVATPAAYVLFYCRRTFN